MDTLIFALNAILPIILLIFFGYFLKRKNFLDEAWFKKGNKLIFRVCLPFLLFTNVYNIESFTAINWSVVIYSEIAIFTVFFLGMLLVKLTIPDDRQKGVVLQCTFRSNFAIIGLTLAESLGGPEGVGIAAILSAFSIPTFNILAVIALTMFNKGENGQRQTAHDRPRYRQRRGRTVRHRRGAGQPQHQRQRRTERRSAQSARTVREGTHYGKRNARGTRAGTDRSHGKE